MDIVVRTFQLSGLLACILGIWLMSIDPASWSLNGKITWFFGTAFFMFLQYRPSGLVIDEIGIVHHRLFMPSRRLKWGEIQSAKAEFLSGEYTGYFLTFKTGQSHFRISIKPYTLEGLAILARLVMKKVPAAARERSIRSLAERRPPQFSPSLFRLVRRWFSGVRKKRN